MDDFVTIASFDSSLELDFILAKDALEKKGIIYYCTNENIRSLKPMPGPIPSNIQIELRVPAKDQENAIDILEGIKAE